MTLSLDDISFVRLAAGEMPESDIALLLGATETEIIAAEREMGLECFYKREMEWCVDCATYRTIVDGECPVCKAKKQLRDLIAIYRAEADGADVPNPSAYESANTRRARNAPPSMPSTFGLTLSQATEVAEAYDKTVEAWELQGIVTEKNRVKKATQRVRDSKGRKR